MQHATRIPNRDGNGVPYVPRATEGYEDASRSERNFQAEMRQSWSGFRNRRQSGVLKRADAAMLNGFALRRALESAFRSVTFLITFTCYGCHLHGSEAGSVDRAHSMPCRERQSWIATRQEQRRHGSDAPATLSTRCGQTAGRFGGDTRGVCLSRMVSAGRPRANDSRPRRGGSGVGSGVRHERLQGLCKPSSEPDGRRRTRAETIDAAGSTRWLWRPEQVSAAIHYVVAEQDEATSVFEMQRG